ncbi:hypothetical protein DID88_004023 [Monilinia fructigena]|uniref:protein-tyrosine-phosphatase n=1 Tax=Monilinia fructigena TaxID=38457 RepID=A0A395IJF3_9HELO|nr:hypothetical protein DID88_004023 [Monilinia fructigena]
MTSPSPRKKNPKSLALNLRPSIDEFTSEPSSPSFIKPPPLKARKKPSILSLNTSTANMTLDPLGQHGMSSMLQRRSLKHSVSSPQMLSMTTPGFGPSGGMTLGDPSRGFGGSRLKESGPPRNTFTINEDEAPSPTGIQMATRAPGMSIGGDSFDRPPTGEDCKSPSYPDGPILMHEPTIHLYSEPKMEEAAEFDLEEMKKEKEERQKQKRLSHASVQSKNTSVDPYAEIPGTAGTISSFQTAYTTQPGGSESTCTESSPSTPRPSTSAMKIPEYIHIPWDHNTDVQGELWDLCQTIESRAKEGKRVLVHCQQGASRSATLIIAYGMYINQDLSANEAYNLAQSKSRWVNPNMSLLFSLNDFKKVIERKKLEKHAAENKNVVIRNKSLTGHRQSLSASSHLDTASSPGRTRVNSSPVSPPKEPAVREPVVMKPAPIKNAEVKEETTSNRNSTIDRLSRFDFGFGDMPQIEPFTKFEDSSKIERLPLQEDKWEFDMMSPRPQDDDEESDIMSPRITEMTRKPFDHAFSRGIPQESSNVTPSLFSPRGFDFQRTAFFSPPAANHPNLPPAQDPRSPPITGEATITRSIDDFL